MDMTSSPFHQKASSSPFRERSQNQKIAEPGSQQQAEKQNPFKKKIEEKEIKTTGWWDEVYNSIFSPEESAFEQGLGQALRGIAKLGAIPKTVYELAKQDLKMPDWSGAKEIPGMSLPSDVSDKLKGILESLPDETKIDEVFDKLTEGKYKPKTPAQETLQEWLGDAILMANPGGFARFLRNQASAAFGNLSKHYLKQAGFEEGADIGKIGTMLATQVINPRGASRHAQQLYTAAENALPRNARVLATDAEIALDMLEADLMRGLPNTGSKAPVLQDIAHFRANIQNGEIPVADLQELLRNINERRGSLVYNKDVIGTKEGRNQLRRNYDRLSRVGQDLVDNYGRTNPEWHQLYRSANEAHAGLQQSRKVGNYIKRVAGKTAFKSGLIGLLTVPGMTQIPKLAIYAPAVGAVTAASIAGGYGALKSYELMHRIATNPTLRRYYMNVVRDAAVENSRGLIRNLKRMDEELAETEKANQPTRN